MGIPKTEFTSKLDFLFNLRGDVFILFTCELALNNISPREAFVLLRLPFANESAISAAILSVQKAFYSLSKYFSGNCKAKLLKATPSEFR